MFIAQSIHDRVRRKGARQKLATLLVKDLIRIESALASSSPNVRNLSKFLSRSALRNFEKETFELLDVEDIKKLSLIMEHLETAADYDLPAPSGTISSVIVKQLIKELKNSLGRNVPGFKTIE